MAVSTARVLGDQSKFTSKKENHANFEPTAWLSYIWIDNPYGKENINCENYGLISFE